MRLLTSSDLRRETGLSRASIARKAAHEIPGAVRADGVHFAFRDCPELREWMRAQKRKKQSLRSPTRQRADEPAMTTALQGARQFHHAALRLINRNKLEESAHLVAAMQSVLRDLEDEIEAAGLPPDERRDPERRLLNELLREAVHPTATKPSQKAPRSGRGKAKP